MTYQRNPPTGFLVDRVDIYQATSASDSQGGQTRTYAKVLTVPGRIRETSGQRYSDSEGRMISWQAAVAWLDLRPDPTKTPKAGDRLVHSGTTYEILSQSKMEGLVECELKLVVV